MFLHYLKVSIRNLAKYKTQTAISITGLAVGFVCFAICSYTLRLDMDWNRNLADIDRLCFIYEETVNGTQTCGHRYAAGQLAKDFPEIEASTSYSTLRPYANKLCEVSTPGGGTGYFNETFLFADIDFLDFFSLRLLTGNREEIKQTPNALLMTESTAIKLFGTLDVIGKTFTNINDFDNKQDVCTVYGVISDFPPRTDLSQYSGLELNSTNRAAATTESSLFNEAFNPYIKLRKGTDPEQFNRKLKAYTLKCPVGKTQVEELKVQVKPLLQLRAFVTADTQMKSSWMFFIIGLLVLLTALFNYVIFLSGRMLNRIKECSIRQVNGSGRGATYLLFFTESILTFWVACFISIILAELSVPLINTHLHYVTIEKNFLYTLIMQYALAGTGGIALLCLVATQKLTDYSIIRRVNIGQTLRRYSLVSRLFICIQLVICFLFLGGTWFVFNQSKLLEKKLTGGLNEETVNCLFEVSVTGDKLQPVRNDILRKLYENPQVENVTRNGMGLFNAWQLGPGYFSWEGIGEEESHTTVGHIYADAGIQELLSITPLEGRFYTLEETDKAVVNESMARLIKRNPVGMQISVKYWGNEMRPYQITGVIPDVINNQNEMNTTPVLPCIYMPYPDNHPNLTCYVKVKPAYRQAFPKEMKSELYKYVNAATPVYVYTIKENTGFYLTRESNLYKATSLFAVICILISLLGIYASVSLETEKRKREVAVRKIHGAVSKDIAWMLGKNNLILLVLAALVAFPLLAVIMNKWLQHYADHVSLDPIPFVLLFLLLGIIVTLTVVWQILHIARSNPAEVIKSE